jgi:hypothetical protein
MSKKKEVRITIVIEYDGVKAELTRDKNGHFKPGSASFWKDKKRRKACNKKFVQTIKQLNWLPLYDTKEMEEFFNEEDF